MAKGQLLVVDDEKDIREMLARHFQFLDYDVVTAENGKDAIEKLQQNRIDVVISDVIMPEMTGVELLRTLRSEFPMVRAIMITGYVTLENALSCMRLKADNCIFKPLEDLTELEEAVENSMRQLRIWQEKLKMLQAMKPKTGGA